MATSDTVQHFLAKETIVISGAGISGLAFAISLHKLWPSHSPNSSPPALTLYERDPCAVPPGREGYSLSLRSDRPSKGIQTLQKMGLLDRMLSTSIMAMGQNEGKSDKGGFCVWDKDFTKVFKVQSKTPTGCPVAGMRIARADLRRTLVEAVEGLPGVSIKWDEGITAVAPAPSTESGERTFQLTTSKGNTTSCTLLVAADGSSSKLRSLLRPDDGLHFAGPTCIYGVTSIQRHHPSKRHDEFGAAISGTGTACFVAPVDREKMLWCLSWIVPEPPVPKQRPLSEEDADALLMEAKEKGSVFGEKHREMLEDTDVKSLTQFNAMDKQPFVHSGVYITAPGLESLTGRTIFLGDANHAVSPFAGNGANLALMDGWDSAESLAHSDDVEEAIREYDVLAVGRAKQIIRVSHFSIMVMHSKGWMLWFWLGFLKLMRLLFFKSVD
ncbi:3'-5' RNA exonuclease complex component [Paraconiothyrium brasiliense]|uniref:3'-5' RNA exonuclease complex component n=1 Tax=Paraconiothyrium brasiliense TaxID=300254 RepID=A0ABR3QKZ4_9PLEO